MGTLHTFRAELLADDVITELELPIIRDYMARQGLDLDDVKFLVQLQSEAREVCPAFEDLLFDTIKKVMLADGRVGLDEQFYLLKTLCADGRVSEREKRLIRELRAESREVTPEFEAFCQQVLSGAL
jgi:hypothetical protein